MGRRFSLVRAALMRLRIWRKIVFRKSAWVVLTVFGGIGTWDTIQSQFLTGSWQENTPRVSSVIGNFPWWAWMPIGLVALILAILEGAYHEIHDRDSTIARIAQDNASTVQPNIKLLGCRAKESDWLSYPQGTPLYRLSLASAEFANEPSVLSPAASATDIVAYVEYFDTAGTTRILGMALYGRWDHAALPASLPVHASLDQLYPTDFPVSGIARTLGVALKFPDDDDCYAWDNSIMRKGDLRQPLYRLAVGSFRVRVTLVGASVYREYWLTLHNRGRGAGLEIEVA